MIHVFSFQVIHFQDRKTGKLFTHGWKVGKFFYPFIRYSYNNDNMNIEIPEDELIIIRLSDPYAYQVLMEFKK